MAADGEATMQVVRVGLAAGVGWLLGGLGPPVAMTVAVATAVNLTCQGGGECSWGLEYLLVLPVLVTSFLWSGPAAVDRQVGRLLAPAAGARAAQVTRRAGLVAMVVLYLAGGNGMTSFTVALIAVAVGVPSLVAWRLSS